MNDILSEQELQALPSGALVQDHDGDYFEKHAYGYWDRVNYGPEDEDYQNESVFRMVLWSARLVREDVGPRPPERLISEPTLTDDFFTRTMSDPEDVTVTRTLSGPVPREITPSVVLDARTGFLDVLGDAHGVDDSVSSEIFQHLVDSGHITDKFFLDYANQEG